MTNEIEQSSPCSTGLPPGVAVLLAYLFGWVSGLIFLLIEKRDQSVRFHAMQSIIISIAFTGLYVVVTALSIVPVVGELVGTITGLLGLALFIVIIIVIVKKFGGKDIKLPVVGTLAEKLLQSV